MTTAKATEYEAELRKEFPRLRIVNKSDDRLSRLIDRALRLITFGGQSSYMTKYVTTIGSTIYVPSDWSERREDERFATLRHEAVHLRQFRRYTPVGMSLIYLFPILPLGLAWGRARLEWEAYAETVRVVAEIHGRAAVHDPGFRRYIVEQFTGPAYGWMWPFPKTVNRWLNEELGRV